MCISNIGNRRQFPSSTAERRPQAEGLLNTVALKDEFQEATTTQEKLHITVQHNYHDLSINSSTMCTSSARRPAQTNTVRSIDTALLQQQRVAAAGKNQYQKGIAGPQLSLSSCAAVEQQKLQHPEHKKSQHQHHAHIIAQHNYHDHVNDNRADYQEEHPARGGVTTPFPLRLHDMLETIAADGFDHVVSFQPHGRCFVVHKPKEFVELLPNYFKLSKLASFQRQLNLYGFQRLTRGRDRGGYYHELFLKDKVFLAHSIQRIKVKGTGVRARSNPDQEPNFWMMPWLSTTPVAESNNTAPPKPKPMMEEQPPMEEQVVVAPIFPSSIPSYYRVSMQMYRQPEDDVIHAFGNKTFHYLDPFDQSVPTVVEQPQLKNKLLGVDELLATEAESFFEVFDFPDNIGVEIEDDAVFGRMLEQMIA